MPERAPSRFRWLLPVLRYGLCVAAIGYLIYTVEWRDYIRLNDAEKTPVRLISESPEGFTVEREGQSVVVRGDEVYWIEVKGRREPAIDPGIFRVAREINGGWLLAALLIFAPVPFMSALRLVWMLRVQHVSLRFWNAVKLTFAGRFFDFALPGTTGGDLIKAYYITRFTDKKTEAVTTIFLDRIIGLMSLVLMAGGLILITSDWQKFRQIGFVLLGIVAGLIVFCVAVFSRRIRTSLRLARLAEALPMGQHLLRIGRTLTSMRNHKVRVVSALLLTFVLQTFALLSFCFFARALGMDGPLSQFFIYIAFGLLIAAIPISPPQAIGVLEVAFIQFFAQDGLNSASQAVALALGKRLIELFWSLPGILVPLLGAHLPSATDLEQLGIEASGEPASPGGLSTSVALQPASTPQ